MSYFTAEIKTPHTVEESLSVAADSYQNMSSYTEWGLWPRIKAITLRNNTVTQLTESMLEDKEQLLTKIKRNPKS